MQTICAYCHTSLKFKEKAEGSILCRPCNHGWEKGVRHNPQQHLAGWVRPATWPYANPKPIPRPASTPLGLAGKQEAA